MPTPRVDIAIFGGGVAGLWTRFALERAGFSTALISTTNLGARQTILAQGILHSGVKYELSAQAAEASRQLLAVQPVWRDALGGKSGPDLRNVRVLAGRMHMWSQGILAGVTAKAASLALRSGVRSLEREQYPGAFTDAPRSVAVYEVDEQVIDTASLETELVRAARGPLIRCLDARAQPAPDGWTIDGEDHNDRGFLFHASRVVFCAGAGNAKLLQSIGVDPAPLCQRRPLHMLAAAGAPADLFAHCIQPGSDKPYLTITTPRDAQGHRVWYIGGDIAERGVDRSEPDQITAGKNELALRLPWLDTSNLRWTAIRIDRAEGRTPEGKRPDGPVVREAAGAIAAWPTKLALAPVMAEKVLAALDRTPRTPGAHSDLLAELARPIVASPPWQEGPL